MKFLLKEKKVSRYIFYLLLYASLSTNISSFAQPPAIKDSAIYLADPAIFFEKGNYYLYGTAGKNTGEGFPVYISGDLVNWTLNKNVHNGFALKKEDVFGNGGFWAPQVFVSNHQIYMAYVADEKIAIATSNQPSGPFTQANKTPLKAELKQIDPFVFIDDDGKKYLYHVRLTSGNKIFVAEMEDDLSGIKPNTLTQCIAATDNWENTAHSNWAVTEGPSVIKHKNTYYLFYTANDFRNPDYAVGYATSSSPYGPWKKFEGNPIVSKKNIGVNGTGHGDFVRDAGNQLYYVFHTHFSDSTVSPRRTAIIKAEFKPGKTSGIDELQVDVESFRFLYSKTD